MKIINEGKLCNTLYSEVVDFCDPINKENVSASLEMLDSKYDEKPSSINITGPFYNSDGQEYYLKDLTFRINPGECHFVNDKGSYVVNQNAHIYGNKGIETVSGPIGIPSDGHKGIESKDGPGPIGFVGSYPVGASAPGPIGYLAPGPLVFKIPLDAQGPQEPLGAPAPISKEDTSYQGKTFGDGVQGLTTGNGTGPQGPTTGNGTGPQGSSILSLKGGPWTTNDLFVHYNVANCISNFPVIQEEYNTKCPKNLQCLVLTIKVKRDWLNHQRESQLDRLYIRNGGRGQKEKLWSIVEIVEPREVRIVHTKKVFFDEIFNHCKVHMPNIDENRLLTINGKDFNYTFVDRSIILAENFDPSGDYLKVEEDTYIQRTGFTTLTVKTTVEDLDTNRETLRQILSQV